MPRLSQLADRLERVLELAETALLRAYRQKYWLMVPLWMGRYIRRGLRGGRSVLVRITPVSRPAA